MNSLLLFGLLAVLLTVASVGWLLRPLWRTHSADTAATARTDVASDHTQRIAVLRDRKREIEADRDAGRVTGSDAASAIDQLAVDLSEALEAGDQLRPVSSTGAPKLLMSALAVLVPGTALALYLILGMPQIIELDPRLARGETTPEQIEQAVADLRNRTERNPGDVEAWVLLAQALRFQGDLDASLAAYNRASPLLRDNDPATARILADHAETLLQKRNGEFAGEPIGLLERAFKVNANDQKTLGLLGAGYYRLGQPERGLTLLRRLVSLLPPESEQTSQIASVITRLEQEIKAAQGPAPVPQTAAQAMPPAPPAAAQSSHASPPSAAQALRGEIRVADALKARLPAGATLFVVARPADGQRMPIAVSRQPFALAPGQTYEFALGDDQSMAGNRPLSSYDQVVLEARVSVSGQAARQSGDLYGVAGPVKPGSRAVVITLDQVVP